MTEQPANPFETPHDVQPLPPQPQQPAGREAYNVITDTVAGPNIRLRDNLFQAVAILAAIVLGTGVGALVAREPVMGAMAGGFIGLFVGLFGSGIFLMIYRLVRHSRGKHD